MDFDSKAIFARLLDWSFLKLLNLSVVIFGAAAFCGGANAQGTEGRPVARLISASPTYTRPRKVNSDASSSTTTAVAATSPSLADANPIERRAFDETNRVRAANGLPPLVWDAELCRMARNHSEEMGRQGYFSHVSPNGQRLRDRAKAVGIIHYQVLGENIAYNLGYDDPGAFAVERWMLSPGHKANILYAGFKAMAIGTYVGADGSVYLTQSFITR